MKLAIIVNATRALEDVINHDTLTQLAEENNLTYELFTPRPDEIISLVNELLTKSFNCFLVVGGDGTVRSVSQILINYDIPLMIYPTGTFNLFAHELGYPNDLAECFRIIKNFKTKKVDVGEVNDMLFVNHTAIGFYSHILKARRKYKNFLKNYKFLKIIFTALNFFNVMPIYTLTIKTKTEESTYKTCMIFVGNNYHYTNFFDFGTRKTLSSGLLAIYIFNSQTRWELIKALWSILFETSEKSHYLEDFTTQEFTILSSTKNIDVDIDGELHKMESPLHYKVHHKKLTVLVP